jgi:uncharacterized membrane protein YcjF (UPF0283 family)
MSFLQKFLPDQNNRALFPGFVAFCVAVLGAALGFTANAFSVHWLSVVAFCVTALGVFGGIYFILHGWWLFSRAAVNRKEKQ